MDAAIDARIEAKLASSLAGLDSKRVVLRMEDRLAAAVTKARDQVEGQLASNLDRKLDKKLTAKMSGSEFEKEFDDRVASTMEHVGIKAAGAQDAAAAEGAEERAAGAPEVKAADAQELAGGGDQSEMAAPLQARAAAQSVEVPSWVALPAERRPAALSGERCTGSMVAGVPKEWCGKEDSPRGSSCLTAFEGSYIQRHAMELRTGLAAIRAPGCFPHGVSVATLGYFRTGSTLLYNVARVWAALGAGEALVAGFSCKSPESLGIGVPGERAERCSMLCKDHDWKEGMAQFATVALMSRRDPWESVCSRKLQKLWCRLRQQGRNRQASEQEKMQYQRQCYYNISVQAQEAQHQCKDLMTMQADIYHIRRAYGGSIAYDVLLSDYQTSPALQVREIAKAIGICREAYEDPALVAMVVAVGTALHDKPDKDMGITQMHDVHTDRQRLRSCSRLREWMRGDEECREWMESNASAAANAVLRRMDALGFDLTPPKKRGR